jgi:hypothetical protein
MKAIIVIILLIIIALIYYRISDSNIIDIVYTWVDQYDPEREHYKKLYKLPKSDGNLDSTRYECSQELLYSIRSVYQYCSRWLGTIYIVVKDGQCPEFLDFSNPNLVLVNHSEIMPKNALPTFNSNAIELCIHKIKNLRNTYVYFNDDTFLGAQFNPVNNGKICVNKIRSVNYKYEKGSNTEAYSFVKSLDNTNYYGKKLLDADINITFAHTPSVCYKPWEQEMETILRENGLWEETVTSKFRQNTNIITNNCFRTFFYLTKKDRVSLVNWGDVAVYLKPGECDIKFAPHFDVASVPKACRESFWYQMENRYPTLSPVEKIY